MKGRTKPAATRGRDKPETPRQVETWQRVKNRYREAGLCNGCAGQAAYGHQMGFQRLTNAPCETCAMVDLPDWLIEKHGPRGARWLNGGGHPDE